MDKLATDYSFDDDEFNLVNSSDPMVGFGWRISNGESLKPGQVCYRISWAKANKASKSVVASKLVRRGKIQDAAKRASQKIRRTH